MSQRIDYYLNINMKNVSCTKAISEHTVNTNLCLAVFQQNYNYLQNF